MHVLSGHLAKKVFFYGVLAAALFMLAFLVYLNEQRSIEHLPFTNEMLYQSNPAFAQPKSAT